VFARFRYNDFWKVNETFPVGAVNRDLKQLSLGGRRVSIRVEDPEGPTEQLDVARKGHLSDKIVCEHRQR
jgi:hypothetical protein